MSSVDFFQSMTWAYTARASQLFSAISSGKFFKIASEVSMQLLVSRSLEIQGNTFGAESQVLMTGDDGHSL